MSNLTTSSLANNASEAIAPRSAQVTLLPIIAFPAWLLCVPSLVWHFRQGNVAAGSLILWVSMMNFFLSINALIWPRDNLDEWWNGNVWCDINIRVHIGAMVGTTASVAMIVRKLAKVMDTNNITVSSSRGSKMKEAILEITWCWIYPLVLIIIYYIVQPVRYMIYGIVGCVAGYDTSWPSVVLSFMWAPITTVIAAGYACLLTYRLYRYRREFVRLVTARNTTKSRFVRLFIICMVIIMIYVPYTIYLLAALCKQVVDPYDWNRVHDPVLFNSILKMPSHGKVPLDKWVQAATGYVIFFIFGTGSDAHKLYKDALLAVGLGKLFPALYTWNTSGPSTPSTFRHARSWTSNLSNKAKSMFWSHDDSMTETSRGSVVREDSLVKGEVTQLRPVMTEESITQRGMTPTDSSMSLKTSFFKGFFRRGQRQTDLLPLHS